MPLKGSPRQSVPLPTLTPTTEDIAYTAGLMDGEGNFHIMVWKSSYLPLATVTNTDPRLMTWLVERFGGRVFTRRRANPKHKAALDWRHHGKHAAALAQLLLPYLVLKREQAKLLISYYDFGSFHWSNRPLPPAEFNRRRAMHIAIKMLNHRGEQLLDTLQPS